jgi:hypothetical protein
MFETYHRFMGCTGWAREEERRACSTFSSPCSCCSLRDEGWEADEGATADRCPHREGTHHRPEEWAWDPW